MTQKLDRILLFSGGMDSYICWYYLKKPQTLYCDLGHRYAALEIPVVQNLIPDTLIDVRLRLQDFEERDAHIPMRNAFLALIGALYAREVFLVVQRGEMDIPDRSPKFFSETENYLRMLNGNYRMKFHSPFFTMTKTEMVRWYLRSGHPADKLLKTRSCYSPTELPCGRCSACFRRWVALANNELEEQYEEEMLGWDGVQVYVDKMKAGAYDVIRTEETFLALKKAGWMI